MNKKLCLFLPIALLIAGCNPDNPTLISRKYQVIVPPDVMYNCPIVKTFPEVTKLTDLQVARLLTQLQKNNITCKNSLDAIRRFLSEAQLRVEK